MLMLSKLSFQHDWKKAAGTKTSLRRRLPLPRYAGRWPFIVGAGNSGVSANSPDPTRDAAPTVTTASEIATEVPSAGAPFEQCDSLVTAIRRTPLQAVGIAAGVGFVAALLVR